MSLAGAAFAGLLTTRFAFGGDPSVLPLLRAIEHLKHVCYGQEGYIRPHFSVAVSEIDEASWGLLSRVMEAGLLPELKLEDEVARLEPNQGLWDPLCSTYLWLRLREMLGPDAAFERWIFCQRVNGRWASPIIPEYLEFEDCQIFEQQLTAHLSRDRALTASVTTVWRQAVNEHTFAMIVAPRTSHMHMTISPEGERRSTREEITLMAPPALATLADGYPPCPVGDPSDLSFLQSWHRFRHWGETPLFYYGLLSHVVEAGKRVWP
ncbi:hypothetical protein [Paraburkholderia dipogonis]|uniref:hypothetical protein n=1 Tax=Paraburkholderia dipogonis TaxID=1211383 RepID=UPI0038B8E2FE